MEQDKDKAAVQNEILLEEIDSLKKEISWLKSAFKALFLVLTVGIIKLHIFA